MAKRFGLSMHAGTHALVAVGLAFIGLALPGLVLGQQSGRPGGAAASMPPATAPSTQAVDSSAVLYGLAAKYPHDAGIEKDPDVLFVESFENDDWDQKWQERSGNHKKYGSLETDPGHVRTGKRSLRLEMLPEAGQSGAGWMNYWWEGSKTAYLRYYLFLSDGDWSNRKTMQLHGHLKGQRYGAGAGVRPDGLSGEICAGMGAGPILYTY
ncbi:MAG: hypothetical protein ACE15C_05020 [Phycisphaerae bacterium]